MTWTGAGNGRAKYLPPSECLNQCWLITSEILKNTSRYDWNKYENSSHQTQLNILWNSGLFADEGINNFNQILDTTYLSVPWIKATSVEEIRGNSREQISEDRNNINIRSEIHLSRNLAKSRLLLASFSIDKSFWNLALSTAVILPCSAQNFRKIC